MTPVMPSLADPISGSPAVAAVQWVQGVLLGDVATAVAILAVAALGAAMLSGRTDLRRGLAVVFGCFVLFGAPAIAAGLRRAIEATAGPAPRTITPAPPVVAIPSPLPARRQDYDPYAGASVPTSH